MNVKKGIPKQPLLKGLFCTNTVFLAVLCTVYNVNCKQIYICLLQQHALSSGKSSDSGIIAHRSLPNINMSVTFLRQTLPLQRRVRGGLSPRFLFKSSINNFQKTKDAHPNTRGPIYCLIYLSTK